jgi:hypothetical protein
MSKWVIKQDNKYAVDFWKNRWTKDIINAKLYSFNPKRNFNTELANEKGIEFMKIDRVIEIESIKRDDIVIYKITNDGTILE